MALDTLEIICAPYEIWLAPTGTAFPDVSEAPAVGWELLGKSGDLSYEEKGVTVTANETLNLFTPAGGTGPRAVWRANEQIGVAADLADLSIATFAKVMNDATVDTIAAGVGTGGVKKFALLKGQKVALFAALLRGASPEADDMVAQFQLPIAYQGANQSITPSKQNPGMLTVNLLTLADDAEGFGDYVAQTAAPTG